MNREIVTQDGQIIAIDTEGRFSLACTLPWCIVCDLVEEGLIDYIEAHVTGFVMQEPTVTPVAVKAGGALQMHIEATYPSDLVEAG